MGCTCSKPPDYSAAAQQQGAANLETARAEATLNRPNIYTPYGSQVWGADPNMPDHYNLYQSLSPAEQTKLNLTDYIQTQGLTSLGNYGPGAINNALSGSWTVPGTVAQDFDPRFMPDQGVQTDSGIWSAPAQQEDVNLASAPGIPTADAATRANVTDAVYRQGASFLDPQFQQQENQMHSDLSNEGIFRDSTAYNNSYDNFNRTKQQAYGDLRDRAIQTGGEEMARDFGLGMQAHQTGVNDILSSGQFHNQSRADMINQLLADMNARNAALGQATNTATQGTQLYNSGLAQANQQLAQSKLLPINVMDAMLSGSQVNNPQFQPFNNQIQVQPPPLYQAAVDQGNYNSGMTGNFLNAGAKLGSAYIMS
ncbi:MAG TPA: hypothetical protein VIY48_08345 [Candidatus Paceibacterota bacterium]